MNETENGLTLLKTKSKTETNLIFNDLDAVKNYIKTESFVVAYLDNEVLIGKYNNAKWDFPENKQIEVNFIRKLRIFNENEELYLWRSQEGIKGRYRTDNEGDETDIIEADQILFGTKAEIYDGYTLLSERRGTRLNIPGNWKANSNDTRVAVRTRHYIDYQYGYQATYVDARFVKFIQLPEGEK